SPKKEQVKEPKTEEKTKAPELKTNASIPINKEHKKELQKQQKLFQQLESKIALLNKEKEELAALLADPGTYSDKDKFLATESSFKEKESALNKLNTEYEVVFEKILELEQK
ncbi:MAG TPA: ABC transporter ATP-binding protein, partial [Chitinophagaceae bacterium]|nr:ABC transporter ATP-binding protein [Chitinophagaceae bacterium]